jgi:hypothetical protein
MPRMIRRCCITAWRISSALPAGKRKDLIPGTPEYINFYVYMFEAYGINARYIQSVPSHVLYEVLQLPA